MWKERHGHHRLREGVEFRRPGCNSILGPGEEDQHPASRSNAPLQPRHYHQIPRGTDRLVDVPTGLILEWTAPCLLLPGASVRCPPAREHAGPSGSAAIGSVSGQTQPVGKVAWIKGSGQGAASHPTRTSCPASLNPTALSKAGWVFKRLEGVR